MLTERAGERMPPIGGEEGIFVAETRARDLITALDEASLSRFHLRAVLVSGMGFFTDAYDLFVIGIASTLIKAAMAPRLQQAGHPEQHDAGRRVPGRLRVRPHRRHGRPQAGVLDGGGDHDRRGHWIGAGAVVLAADRGPSGARPGHRRRLPGQRGADERVRQPQGPRQTGRDGVLHPGDRPDRGAAGGAGPAGGGRGSRRLAGGPCSGSARFPPRPCSTCGRGCPSRRATRRWCGARPTRPRARWPTSARGRCSARPRTRCGTACDCGPS